MNRLQKALEELKAEEEKKKKKKKPNFTIKKEKHLNYYSGWGKGKTVEEENEEKQSKLEKFGGK